VARDRSFADWAKDLDNRIIGRPVPDDRPITQRVLRPRPAVWSRRGRFLAGLILLAMFATAAWGPDSLLGALLIVPIWAAFFVVIAADERKRARRFYNPDDREG
jgi:hypothetical protein